MSITSSKDQDISSAFSELLTRYPELATWLSRKLQHEAGARAEKLLPAFLAECIKQDISGEAYPFSANDSGLNDLRRYLALASKASPDKQEKIHISPTPSVTQASSEVSDEPNRINKPEKALAAEDNSTSLLATTSEEKDTRQNKKSSPPTSIKNRSKARKKSPTAKKELQAVESEIAAEESIIELKASQAEQPAERATGGEITETMERVTQSDMAVPGNGWPEQEQDTQATSSLETSQGMLTESATGISEASQSALIEPTASILENASEEATAQSSGKRDTDQEQLTKIDDASTNEQPVVAQNEQQVLQSEEAEPPKEHRTSEKKSVAPDDEGQQAEGATDLSSEVETAKIPAQAPGPVSPNKPFKWLSKRERSVRQQNKRQRRPRSKRQRIIIWLLLVLILGGILVPAGFLVNFGVKAYNVYQDLSDEAHSAVGHLLNVKTILTGNSAHLTGLLDTGKLQKAQQEFRASESDFQQLQKQLKNSDTINTIVTYFPSYRTTLKSAQIASVIGIDVAQIGQIGTARAIELAPNFNGPLLAHSDKPLVTQAMLNTIGTTIDEITPLLRDIQANASGLSLSSLPISAQEKAQIEPLLSQLPQVLNDLGLVRNLLGTSGWLLGVSQPRTFLVQTMDRAELRGSGGFTGQYGEMTVSGGRVAPFSLKDISLIEYVDGSANQGQYAPEQYRSWWPFANWGLRDSNISADFPTTAQLAIDLYKQEVGKSVDGVISFTPIVIEHILDILGPISISGYNITVTAQNLEDVLHFYQLDNSGIYKQKSQQPDDAATSERKRFTNKLASLFMDKLRAASPTKLLAIAHQILYDLKTKDLQMYFTDPAAEQILKQYGYAAQIDRSTTHDGFYVVQQNLSASKASQYVATTMNDTITLDSKGGATHLLQMRLVYNQAGPVYGYDTYYDYLRVYVPTNSQLLWGKGFSTGTPLCGGTYGSCPTDNVFPDGELVCPSGQYQPGTSPPSLSGSDGATFEPLQTLGGPTNTTSDEPGRAMYGGWLIIPKNCTLNVTLSWYVPPRANTSQPYSVLVQRQAGTFPDLDLTILPSNCVQQHTSGLHFSGILTEDRSFTVPTASAHQKEAQSCYPRSDP